MPRPSALSIGAVMAVPEPPTSFRNYADAFASLSRSRRPQPTNALSWPQTEGRQLIAEADVGGRRILCARRRWARMMGTTDLVQPATKTHTFPRGLPSWDASSGLSTRSSQGCRGLRHQSHHFGQGAGRAGLDPLPRAHPQQAFVLNYLAGNPGAIQRDIARETRTTPANVSGVLRGLEARSLVGRRFEGDDERSKRVFATDAGIELITGHGEAMVAADEPLLTPSTSTERATLQALLDKITADLPDPGNP